MILVLYNRDVTAWQKVTQSHKESPIFSNLPEYVMPTKRRISWISEEKSPQKMLPGNSHRKTQEGTRSCLSKGEQWKEKNHYESGKS